MFTYVTFQAFESQNGPKKASPTEEKKSPSPGRPQSPTPLPQTKDVATMEVTQTTAQTTHTLTMVEGRDGGQADPPIPLTKEEIEQLYETESPKKLMKPPLGKTRSAGKLILAEFIRDRNKQIFVVVKHAYADPIVSTVHLPMCMLEMSFINKTRMPKMWLCP